MDAIDSLGILFKAASDTADRTRLTNSSITTPMQTFLDSLPLAREKMLDSLLTPAPEPERSPAQRSAGEGTAAGTAA